MGKTTVTLITLLVAACATPEQRQERALAVLNEYSEACKALGFQIGTDGFGNCMLKLIDRQQAQAPIYVAPPPVYQPPRQNRTDCYRTVTGWSCSSR